MTDTSSIASVPSGAACLEPTVIVVIVNWNAGRLLRDCLVSVERLDRSGYRIVDVVLVDNASNDGSLEAARALDVCTRIVTNEENRGFAYACNQGVQLASGSDYILFLNPDTRLERTVVAHVVALMTSAGHRSTAVCGVQMRDDSGRVSSTCARVPSPWDFVVKALGLDKLPWSPFDSYLLPVEQHRESRYVDHVIGAFYFVRTGVFRELEGFDERFFLYLEDLDFSLRVHQSGWRVFFDADEAIHHKGGGSSEQVPAERLYRSLESRLLFAQKHFDRVGLVPVVVSTLLVEPVVRSVQLLVLRRVGGFVHLVWAYAALWRSFPSRWKWHRGARSIDG